jgi:hypothetical protein
VTKSPNHLHRKFEIVDDAIVDDEQWFTVRIIDQQCVDWVRNISPKQQWEHPGMGIIGCLFDIHEKIYTLLALKWS